MAVAGFGKKEDPPFGTETAKAGEWYSYALHSSGSYNFGRFRNRDKNDPILYFDQAPIQTMDEKGTIWCIKDGEISVPLPHLKTFIPTTIEDAKNSIDELNWFRKYWGEWVYITNKGMPPVIGKAHKVFQGTFSLMPYVSELSQKIISEGKEKVVGFSSPGSIEAITEKMLKDYLDSKKN